MALLLDRPKGRRKSTRTVGGFKDQIGIGYGYRRLRLLRSLLLKRHADRVGRRPFFRSPKTNLERPDRSMRCAKRSGGRGDIGRTRIASGFDARTRVDESSRSMRRLETHVRVCDRQSSDALPTSPPTALLRRKQGQHRRRSALDSPRPSFRNRPTTRSRSKDDITKGAAGNDRIERKASDQRQFGETTREQ